MPGVRLSRYLVSTAIVLLVSGATGAVQAEPKFGSTAGLASAAPAPQAATPSPITGDQAPVATPPETHSEPAKIPAATAKPQAWAERPVVATAMSDVASPPPEAATKPVSPEPQAAKPDESSEPQAATPASSEAPSQANDSASPATDTPPAAETSASTTQPATAIGGDEVPTPAASASPAASAPATTATVPAETPAPSAAADANAPIADQLRELANGKFDRIIGGKKERAAFESFYSSRSYAPLWITDGKVNERAKAAIAYLGQVDTDGLDPADYPVPNFASLSEPAALAEAEIRLSASVAIYAHHAQIGRVHWSRVSGDIFYEMKAPSPSEVLANLAGAADVAAALDAYEPQTPNYRALKAKLAELRAGKGEAEKTPIPNGPVLKIGTQDARVALLRARLDVAGDGTTYDKALADAVKNFQQEHDQKPSGLLTPQTVQALNGRQPDRPADIIIANMERWRWIPHDLGKNYVIVNLPDFTLRVFQNEHQVWMTRIVDGKPEMPTPIMTAEMKYITINPTWNVPPSIVAREYMPALQQDPTVLERMGLKVSTNPDGTVHISQPPGDANALGRIRFNFPNKFLVYQHDTPNKNLFALERRAFSHGCMRVQNPVKYAEVLLSIVRPGEGYTEDRIRKMFGDSEADIQFPKFLPVHLTYQTAFVDEDGKLEFRDDVYGRDKTLLAILKSDERKVADIAVERRENTVRREALAMPESGGAFGGRYYPNGNNFFTRLFGFGGDPTPTPAAAQPRKRTSQNRTEIH